jgi:hypothetical protein
MDAVVVVCQDAPHSFQNPMRVGRSSSRMEAILDEPHSAARSPASTSSILSRS